MPFGYIHINEEPKILIELDILYIYGLVYTCNRGVVKTHGWTAFFTSLQLLPLRLQRQQMGVYACYKPVMFSGWVLPNPYNGVVPQTHGAWWCRLLGVKRSNEEVTYHFLAACQMSSEKWSTPDPLSEGQQWWPQVWMNPKTGSVLLAGTPTEKNKPEKCMSPPHLSMGCNILHFLGGLAIKVLKKNSSSTHLCTIFPAKIHAIGFAWPIL